MTLSAPEPLTDAHDVSAFDCGQPALNAWLRSRALSNHRKGFTVVMVVHEGGRVVGYYGLAPTAVPPPVAPRRVRTGQPPDPLPCLLIGQLATDRASAGRGVGGGLLRHALERCLAAADIVGGRAVLVRAVDEAAARWWRARDFLPSPADPFLLFKSMADVAESVRTAARLGPT